MGFRHGEWTNIFREFAKKTNGKDPCDPAADLKKLCHQFSTFDLPIKTHSVINYDNVNTWDDFAREVYNAVKREALCSFHIKEINISVDDPNKVPRNKEQTQKSRNPKGIIVNSDDNNNEESKDKEEIFLTSDDICVLDIGEGDIIQKQVAYYEKWLDNPSLFKAQLLSDRKMKFKITSWLACQVIKRAALESCVKITAEHIEKSILLKEFPEIDIAKEFKNFHAYKVIATLDHNEPIDKIKIRAAAPSFTGEGEYLCVKAINRVNPSNSWKYVIHTTDKDVFLITLLNFMDFINPKDKKYMRQIYFMDGKEIWNMNDIHDAIWHFFSYQENREKYQIRTPVHVLCWLIILDGTDYTEGLNGFSAKGIWDFFWKEGYKFWSWDFEGKKKPPFDLEFDLGARNNPTNLIINVEDCAIPFIEKLVEPRTLDHEKLEQYCYRILWTMGNMINGVKAAEIPHVDPETLGWVFDTEKCMLVRRYEIVKEDLKKKPKTKKEKVVRNTKTTSKNKKDNGVPYSKKQK